MPTDPNARATVVVPGHGTVVVSPDVASLRLGVVVVRPTAGEAREAAAATMTAVVDALLAGGIERRDLRTSLVSLDAVRDYSSERGPQVTGYQLSNTIEATVRRLESAGALIDAALAAGATSMDGLSFRVADPREPLAEARRLAVADARSRAETLAAEAGLTLGRVVEIVEGGLAGPRPPMPMAELRMKSAADTTTPVEAGTDELAVSLTVTYAVD
ncbi:MAG TPA: SIMPL domain-containing protein [Candidatus Limnocylindrales bacterium]|nr:SIMPL domain-containing protein [Candidatus Limnocylindrales bacterium]